MVRIVETEFTDDDGQIRKLRTIESGHARIMRPDGTVEEYTDINAEEQPWTQEDEPSKWHVFGIPMHKALEQRHTLATSTLTLLSENAEIILKLGSITIGMQLSSDGNDFLIGKEVTLGR